LRVVRENRQVLRDVPAWGKWLIYDRRRWRRDELSLVMVLAKNTIRRMYREATRATDDSRTSRLLPTLMSEQLGRLRAMVTLAQCEPTLAMRPGQFDADPWLLNCREGTVDLRTGGRG
jgi:putative DNA primase/helicase